MKLNKLNKFYLTLLVILLSIGFESCHKIYRSYFNDCSCSTTYGRLDNKKHSMAYKLTRKYGNSFHLKGVNYDFYWSYYTKDEKNYIYTLAVPRPEFLDLTTDDKRRLGRQPWKEKPENVERLYEYHQDIDWVYDFDNIELAKIVSESGFDTKERLWLFLEEDKKVIGNPVRTNISNVINGKGRGSYNFLDNLAEDITRYSLIDSNTLEHFDMWDRLQN